MLNKIKVSLSLSVSIIIFVLHLFLFYLLITGNKENLWLLVLSLSPSVWIPVFVFSFINMVLSWRITDISPKKRLLVRTVVMVIFGITLAKLVIILFIYVVVTSPRIV